MATVVNAAVEAGIGVGEDAVSYSSVAGETCTPICSETTESSIVTGEEDTRVYSPSVGISTENVDCKRWEQYPSPGKVFHQEQNINSSGSVNGSKATVTLVAASAEQKQYQQQHQQHQQQQQSSDATGETVTYGERASDFTFSLVLERNLLTCFV